MSLSGTFCPYLSPHFGNAKNGQKVTWSCGGVLDVVMRLRHISQCSSRKRTHSSQRIDQTNHESRPDHSRHRISDVKEQAEGPGTITTPNRTKKHKSRNLPAGVRARRGCRRKPFIVYIFNHTIMKKISSQAIQEQRKLLGLEEGGSTFNHG